MWWEPVKYDRLVQQTHTLSHCFGKYASNDVELSTDGQTKQIAYK
jgi:hypothetical protein